MRRLPVSRCANSEHSVKSVPTVRDVRDGFEPTDAITAYPMVEGNDTEQEEMSDLSVKPDKFLAPLVTQPRAGPTTSSRLALLWPKVRPAPHC